MKTITQEFEDLASVAFAHCSPTPAQKQYAYHVFIAGAATVGRHVQEASKAGTFAAAQELTEFMEDLRVTSWAVCQEHAAYVSAPNSPPADAGTT